MQISVTPLTARSQTMVAVFLVIMATLAVSPTVDVFVLRWPLRFNESIWRYDTFVMFLSNGPQLVILIGVIAIAGALTGYRQAVRAAAVVLAIVAVAHVVLLLLYVLDYFQVRRLVAQARVAGFKAIAVKTLVFGGLVSLAAAWGALRAWQASESEGAGLRRQKGDGLLVGQPKAPRPPE